MSTKILLAATLLVPGAAWAHPQHAGGDGHGPLHFVTDPFHIAMFGAAVLLAVVMRRRALRRRTA